MSGPKSLLLGSDPSRSPISKVHALNHLILSPEHPVLGYEAVLSANYCWSVSNLTPDPGPVLFFLPILPVETSALVA